MFTNLSGIYLCMSALHREIRLINMIFNHYIILSNQVLLVGIAFLPLWHTTLPAECIPAPCNSITKLCHEYLMKILII